VQLQGKFLLYRTVAKGDHLQRRAGGLRRPASRLLGAEVRAEGRAASIIVLLVIPEGVHHVIQQVFHSVAYD
jgi:hypothetical protein